MTYFENYNAPQVHREWWTDFAIQCWARVWPALTFAAAAVFWLGVVG